MNTQTNTLTEAETQAYQENSAKLKFRQNLVQGLGAAVVFGIAAAFGRELFVGATTAWASGTTAVFAAYAIGILAVAALGVGCLYFGSKFYAESVRLDQIHQAKQITKGINGKTQGVEPVRPVPFTSQHQENALDVEVADAPDAPPAPAPMPRDAVVPKAAAETPKPAVREVQLQDKVVPITALQAGRA